MKDQPGHPNIKQFFENNNLYETLGILDGDDDDDYSIPPKKLNNMIQVVEDSHFWTDLDHLINYLNTIKHIKDDPNVIDLEYNLTKLDLINYLITGLQNTKKHNYKLSKNTIPLSSLKVGNKFKFDDIGFDDNEFYFIEQTEDHIIAWNDTQKKILKTNQLMNSPVIKIT